MSTLPTSEVLNRAADLIERQGWVTGTGWPTVDREDAPLCLEGGIMAALGLRIDAEEDDDVEGCPAYRAVHDYLELRDARDLDGWPVVPLWMWNDDREHASEVIEVLRAVAVIEAARENASVEVSA